MMKKWLIIPALLLLSSCQTNEQAYSKPSFLYRNETIEDIKVGDTIVVEPKTLTYEGQSKVVNGQIIFPDGSSKVGKSFIIEMPGIYEVNYRAFFGTHEESISLFYHCHRTSGDFFISSDKSNPAQAGTYSHPLNSETIKGAKLLLDTKSVFTYNGEIDFTSFDPNKSFLDLIIDTSKQETSDIESFTIRITDVDNSSNYIDILVNDSGPIDDDGRGSYWKAGSSGQFKTGYENGRNSKIWGSSSKYGTNVGMSFRDLPDRGAKVAKLYFNYAEKELYISPLINSGIKSIITDFDDKEIYGSNVWKGFTNGKATISIFANSLLNNYATLIVSKIGNFDLSPLDFVDTDAPAIKVNYMGQSTIMPPMATVNKPYKIFEAAVSDNYDRNLSYSTYVTFLDEAHNIEKDITISNGYFTPKEVGKYTITYVAKDHSNNYATKTVDIYATSDSQEMSIALDEDSITQELYTVVNLPSIEEVKSKITGGSGKPKLERFVFDKDGNIYEFENDYFIPEEIGQYSVVYLATDYIGNEASATLTVNVTDPHHPVFIEDFNLPKTVIKGHKYTLPTYVGAEVGDNEETVYLSSKVYVNGEVLEDNSFVADETCVVKYELTGKTGVEEYVESIEVIDTGDPIDLGKYFHGDFSTEVNRNDVTLSADSGNASSLFISALPYDNLYVEFALINDLLNCDELVFKFTDSTNSNNSLSFHFSKSGEKAYISIGADITKYEFTGFEGEEGLSFVIDFTTSDKTLRDIYHKDVAVAKYNDKGNLFDCFGGGVYLEITMNNISSSSSFKMLTISNQSLGHKGRDPYKDFIKPIVILKEDSITEQEYNADAFIPLADVFDVLSDAEVTLTVKGPDNKNRIVDADATKRHTFVLDQFGRYIITYTATDSAGKSATYRRNITVYDIVPPELTINGSLASIYGLNAAITIPTYTVSDNLGKYTVDVFLIMPNNEQRLLLEDNNGLVTSYLEKDNMYYNASFKVDSRTFRAEQFGRYTLRFVAYDNDFNKTVKELHFEVK